jgi:hypothetical protein
MSSQDQRTPEQLAMEYALLIPDVMQTCSKEVVKKAETIWREIHERVGYPNCWLLVEQSRDVLQMVKAI